jgi:hypothetical protein
LENGLFCIAEYNSSGKKWAFLQCDCNLSDPDLVAGTPKMASHEIVIEVSHLFYCIIIVAKKPEGLDFHNRGS